MMKIPWESNYIILINSKKSEEIKMKIKLKDLEPHVSGIYKLTYPNNKIYIGQSKDIKRRMYEHNNFNRLKNHFNSPCDLAIKKYGKFEEIEILDLCQTQNELN